MTEKRLAALFLCFLVLFSLVLGRCYLVASNEQYAAAAQEQTVATITADQTRGNFYDRNGQPLTGGATNYEALCLPGDSSYSKLFDLVSEESQNILYQRRNSVTPFFIQVPEDLSDQGFFVCIGPARWPLICWAIWTGKAGEFPGWNRPLTPCLPRAAIPALSGAPPPPKAG